MSNVVAGSQSTLAMSCGLTYEQLIIKFSGVTLAQLKKPELVINGKTIQQYDSCAEIDAINQFYGRGASANGVLVLYFVRPELDTLADQRLTALGTQDVQNLTFQFDVDAGAAAPVVECFAIQSAQQPLGMVTKVKSFSSSFATDGEQEISNIPRSGARIAAIHFKKADISKIEVEANSTLIVEQEKSFGEEIQSAAGRTAQTATMTHVDFLLDGDINHALQTVGLFDLRFRPTLDTSGQVGVLVEYLDQYAGI